MWDLSNELRCVAFSYDYGEGSSQLPSVTALNIYTCFPNVAAARIEYAACIFRAVIISRASAFFPFWSSNQH